MKTNEKYLKYISNRINGTPYDKPGELYAITAVDHYGAVGDFYLLQFLSYNCFLFRCVSSTDGNPKRLAIKGIRSFEHKLQNVFKPEVFSEDKAQKNDEAYYDNDGVCVYDEYYDNHYQELKEYNQRLAEALESIKLDDSLPIYVCGYYIESAQGYTGKKAVWYALQQKAAKVVRIEHKKNLGRTATNRVVDVKGIRKRALNTSVDMTIVDCFGCKGKVVFVPLADETLDSVFFDTTTWRDILPDVSTDKCCQIAGVPCRCIKIQMEMDIYNNVFCRTTDENDKTKCTLVVDALNVKPELETMQQKEKAQQKETSTKPTKSVQPSTANPKPRDPVASQPAQKPQPKPTQSQVPQTGVRPLKKATSHYSHFLLDTNSLLDCPDLIPSIVSDKSKKIVIPMMVSTEINDKKDRRNEVQEQAKVIYKYINSIYEKDIILNEQVTDEDKKQLPEELTFRSRPDNLILALLIRYKRKGIKICLVTSDAGLRKICQFLEEQKRPGVLYPNQII